MKCWIDDDLIASAVAKNKKDAKKKSAENAMKILLSGTRVRFLIP